MRGLAFLTPPPRHRLLDEGRRTRAMLWIMAIMLFLTVLAAALGLGMAGAGRSLDRQLSGRLTVQLVDGDPTRRDAQVTALVRGIGAIPGVTAVGEVDRAHLAELLRPWLGDAGLDAELPMPAMIDVNLVDGNAQRIAQVRQVAARLSRNARIDQHAQWLSPVAGFITTLIWFAGALVVLMAMATTAVVLLTARAGLDTHRDTIGVLHMLGATDAQVARLFQRRIAVDTLVGGLIGSGFAMAAVWLLGRQSAGLGSELLGNIALARTDWLFLAAIPLIFATMAMMAARVAVLRTLGRTL